MPTARPIVPGVDDHVVIRGMSVRIPAEPGWQKRVIPMNGGMLFEFERDLPGGNRAQVHLADYFFETTRSLNFELASSGLDDTARLTAFIESVLNVKEVTKGWRSSEWADVVRGPQRQYAVCRELHVVREDLTEGGKGSLWQDWMLFCLDPISHLPVQVDYAERYPATDGSPSPIFPAQAATLFDSIEFRDGARTSRPSAEVIGAIVQANIRLFDGSDREDYPATVVFSLEPKVSKLTMRKLGTQLFKLKNTLPQDPWKRIIAVRLTEERARYHQFTVVHESLAGSDSVYIGDVMIQRNFLPKGHIGKGSGYGDFLLKFRLGPADKHRYQLQHIGIQWLK